MCMRKGTSESLDWPEILDCEMGPLRLIGNVLYWNLAFILMQYLASVSNGLCTNRALPFIRHLASVSMTLSPCTSQGPHYDTL